MIWYPLEVHGYFSGHLFDFLADLFGVRFEILWRYFLDPFGLLWTFGVILENYLTLLGKSWESSRNIRQYWEIIRKYWKTIWKVLEIYLIIIRNIGPMNELFWIILVLLWVVSESLGEVLGHILDYYCKVLENIRNYQELLDTIDTHLYCFLSLYICTFDNTRP